MVAEQEVNDLFCGDVSVAIQARRRQTTFTAGRSRDIVGTKVVQGKAVPVRNGLGFVHAFANVLDCGVTIEDRVASRRWPGPISAHWHVQISAF